MLPQTRQILNHYYKEEVARLEEIVGRKVPGKTRDLVLQIE